MQGETLMNWEEYFENKIEMPPDKGRASRTANGRHPQPYQLLVHASFDDWQSLFASLVSSNAASSYESTLITEDAPVMHTFGLKFFIVGQLQLQHTLRDPG